MTQLSKAALLTLYNDLSTGQFKDAQAIPISRLRQYVEDMIDSVSWFDEAGLPESQYRGDWNDFETDGFPTDVDAVGSGDDGELRGGDQWLLKFTDPDTPIEIDSVEYGHNYIIQYAGTGMWNSWPANQGSAS
jgi:hypothetical protein